MSITTKTRKTLWGKSGNRCAICKIELVHEKDPFNQTLNLGEECHIISEKENRGPRYELIEGFDYDDAENLMLLCSNHHTTIDEKIGTYTVKKLKDIKRQHEEWVRKNLETTPENTIEPTKEQELLSFITENYEKRMLHKSMIQLAHDQESLAFAHAEIAKMNNKITSFAEKIKTQASHFNVIVRSNEYHIVDVIFNFHTLLVQFYQPIHDSISQSYLFFGMVKGLFDSKGNADVFHRPVPLEIMRLRFAKNGKGEYGWIEDEEREKFHTSEEIIDIWFEKFFKEAMPKNEEIGGEL